MAFKKVSQGGIENLVEFSINQPVEGVYLGTTTHTAKDGEIFLMGRIMIADQEQVFFLGGQLKFLMGLVEVNSKVRITYKGLTEQEVECKKGGKKHIHQYIVEKDS